MLSGVLLLYENTVKKPRVDNVYGLHNRVYEPEA
jgi:hypothetical protein